MLKTNTNSSGTLAVITASILLLIFLGAIAMLKVTTSAPQLSAPASNSASQAGTQHAAPASASENGLVRSGTYPTSEQALRARIDNAIEQHKTELVQWWMNILNERYEHRAGQPY